MPHNLTPILDEIVRQGKKKGLKQKDICHKAGVGPVTISRARKQGDIRFSTLEKLANSVGLKLTLVTDDPLIELVEKGELFS